jgi:hypothetical protein
MLGNVTIIENGTVHVYDKPIDREIVLASLVILDRHEVSGTYFSDGSFDLELKSKHPGKVKDMNLIFTATP